MLKQAHLGLNAVDSFLQDLNALPKQLIRRLVHVARLPMGWMFSDGPK
jgi:hypothetical protein